MTIRLLLLSNVFLGCLLCAPASACAQRDVPLPDAPPAVASLPDAPSFVSQSLVQEVSPQPDAVPVMLASNAPLPTLNLDIWSTLFPPQSTSAADRDPDAEQVAQEQQPAQQQPVDSHGEPVRQKQSHVELDANGNPIPINRQQPQRILGFMPNFRSVSAGAKPHPPGWKYNFTIATHQAFDYSSFIFLGLTSISAEALNEHPVLGKGIGGFYSYTWRGFLDKTDGNYLQGWFLPSLLHEDTRYYPLGDGHRIVTRALYVISRQGVTRTYGGRETPNIAGLGGKVLTQIISRTYYPAGATSFGVLAEKFGYAAMRDVAFTSIREFYPDIAAHYVRKHREKIARMAAAADSAAAQSSSPVTKP